MYGISGRSPDVDASRSGIVSFHQLEDRVNQLEKCWQELNVIPTNSELFRRLKRIRMAETGEQETRSKEPHEGQSSSSINSDIDDIPPRLKKTGQPVYDMWQNMLVVKQLEKHTDGIDKVFKKKYTV
jgi:hypothetical protein